MASTGHGPGTADLRVRRAAHSATLLNVKTVLSRRNYYKQHFKTLLLYLSFLFIPPDSLDDTVLLLSTS